MKLTNIVAARSCLLLVESTPDDVSEQRRAYWRLGRGVIDLIMKEGVLMELIEAQPWTDAWNEGLMSPGDVLMKIENVLNAVEDAHQMGGRSRMH